MNGERPFRTVNLKLEKINLLGQAGMNATDNARLILHHDKSVVFQRFWHWPMTSSSHPGYTTHIAQEPAEKINQMDSLLHELPTTDDFRIRAPLLFDPFATGNAVASSTKYRPANLACSKQTVSFQDRGMKPMIEAAF